MFQTELDIMILHLKEYFEHISENPQSLIARIYGIYQVQMEGIVPVNLILMANTIQIYDTSSTLPHIYDLKGSWNNRIIVKGEN